MAWKKYIPKRPSREEKLYCLLEKEGLVYFSSSEDTVVFSYQKRDDFSKLPINKIKLLVSIAGYNYTDVWEGDSQRVIIGGQHDEGLTAKLRKICIKARV